MRDKRNRSQIRRFLSRHVCLQEKSECYKFFLLLAFVLVIRICCLPIVKSRGIAHRYRMSRSDSLRGANRVVQMIPISLEHKFRTVCFLADIAHAESEAVEGGGIPHAASVSRGLLNPGHWRRHRREHTNKLSLDILVG